MAGHIRELKQMGVACLKIEGRMKRPEYVSVVTSIYAQAIRENREPTGEVAQLAAAFFPARALPTASLPINRARRCSVFGEETKGAPGALCPGTELLPEGKIPWFPSGSTP